MTRRYEIVYIFDGALSEEQVTGHLTRLHALLAAPDNLEPVTQVSHWGKRQLAFRIKRHDTGYYAVVQFKTKPTQLVEFERAVKLEESVIRHMLVENEGEAPRAPVAARTTDDNGDGDGDE
ncbi:MAG: 30S ribosomal protein S6 [Gemmatimonadetes bacterium]|nr:30S ribosomal protein S6 [Gemmatimonadota bacterium]